MATRQREVQEDMLSICIDRGAAPHLEKEVRRVKDAYSWLGEGFHAAEPMYPKGQKGQVVPP